MLAHMISRRLPRCRGRSKVMISQSKTPKLYMSALMFTCRGIIPELEREPKPRSSRGYCAPRHHMGVHGLDH